MKHKPLNIVFHNPNNKEDSEKIATDFVVRVSQNVVAKYIFEQKENTSDKKQKRMINICQQVIIYIPKWKLMANGFA